MGDVQALSSSLDDLDRQEDEELIAAATATEGRKLQMAKGKGRASPEKMRRFYWEKIGGKRNFWGFARKKMENIWTIMSPTKHGVALKV